MRIKKTSNTRAIAGKVVNVASESTTDTYSCDYLNGTVLYDNSSGSIDEITLSDNSANYNFLEVYGFFTGYNFCAYIKVAEPNGKRIELKANGSTSSTQYLAWTVESINNNKITPYVWGVNVITNNGALSVSRNTNSISISKVIGYK